jgi:pimeloyl-ACP methyl ester carboxylesterase
MSNTWHPTLVRCAALALCAWAVTARADQAPVVTFAPGVYITNWLIAGTFPNKPREGDTNAVRPGFITDFLQGIGGETQALFETTTTIPGRPWTLITNIVSPSSEIDLDSLFGVPEQVVAYALVTLDVADDETAYLRIGSDDGVHAWLDDTSVIEVDQERGYVADENWARVHLRQGPHRLLLKIEDFFGAWKFSARFVTRRTHRQLLAQTISDELMVDLLCPTAAWQTVRAQFSTAPALADFSYHVNGAWIGGATTQAFIAKPGDTVAVPEAFALLPNCRLEARAEGLPGKEPRVAMTIFAVPLMSVLTNFSAQAAQLMQTLAATSSTARLAAKHEGLLRYYFALANSASNVERCSTDVPAQKLLTEIERILERLQHGQDYFANQRRTFMAAYVSPDDGSGQPFMVDLPPLYDPRLPAPLVVFLHDTDEDFSTLFPRQEKGPTYIAVRTHGRGRRGGYVGLAARDVLQVIEYMTNFYAVDPDRVYVIGNGMGGYGVWHLSVLWPQLFAACVPLNGYSADLTLANVRNLPLWIMHGEKDLVVPVEFSRAAAAYLMARAYPTLYTELRDVGYRLQSSAENLRVFDWLVNQRREPAPPDVVLQSVYRNSAQAYWLHSRGRVNPRQPATAQARFFSANDLVMFLDNVALAEVTLPARYVDAASLLSVIVNGQTHEVAAPLPTNIYIVHASNGYTVARAAPADDDAVRAYRSGSWQSLYEGEPLLVVYGTGGDPRGVSNMLACAQALAHWSFVARAARYGTCAVKADVDVTDTDVTRCNLILLGGVTENKVVANYGSQLITKLSTQDVLINGVAESLSSNGLWLCQYNPAAPQRLLWIWASSEPAFFDAQAAWLQDWFYPADDPPDLLLLRVGSARYLRAAHFTANWVCDQGECNSTPIRRMRRPREFLTRTCGQALQKVTGSDFAWLPDAVTSNTAGMLDMRAAEAATLLIKGQTVIVCELYGSDLLSLRDPASAAPLVGGGRLYPTPLDVISNAVYRVAVMPRALRSLADAAKGRTLRASYHEAPARDTLRLLLEEALVPLQPE